MEYLLHLLIFIGIYTILSQSLAISSGYGGMISLAHACFYGIGAYTAALLSIHFHFPFLIVLLFAMLLNGLIALIVSSIALRTVDDYFIICTLSIQIIVFSLMNNLITVTNGPLGISGIPSIHIFTFDIQNKTSFLILTFIFVSLVYLFLKYITSTAFGRSLRALSEDEIFTQSLGKNVYLHKITAFTISAMLASIAGVLYAHYVTYIDPTSFTIDESIFILSIVIIGGMQNLNGIIITAAILVLLPEGLRFIGLPSTIAANIRQIIYGALLIFMMFKWNKKRNISLINQSHFKTA